MSKMNMTNIYICLNSQHSMWRIKEFYSEYPHLYHLIPALYGNMQDQVIEGEKMDVSRVLAELSHISLYEFLDKTAAEIIPLRCRFNMKNCPLPQMKTTRYGKCLFYNLESFGEITIAGPQSGLVFYGAYNKSDQTTGALQFVDGLSIFYGDGDEELMLMKQRTTALPDLLSQISLFRHEYEMKSESCATKDLYFYRTYSYEKCQIFFTFNYQNCGDCPKDCEYKNYVRSVEYAKYHQPIHKTLEGFRSQEGSKGIDVAAFQVFFPTLTSTVHKEEEDYTAQQFFSELGGAAGLVLGISLISIIRMIDYSISLTVERIISAQNMILETFQTDGKKVSSQSTQVEPLYIPTSAINEDKGSKIFSLNYLI
ncbi:Oidioi.mRNA.OKI2018_I69.chr2.g4371.t1.cds [Oikopleura dioica]|uniref:Oidioi.mRNA.OKI2018_I69.chr2.g4371.t1.cds n=1 Tax=Oikopleura dioica TaxID=34765 RepID=A0ABN7SX44_OIKDI|nr:Oidioi.mRNA.OKI2018_I69.chr2.g4371.t1.cds [Oikopleura dioica]